MIVDRALVGRLGGSVVEHLTLDFGSGHDTRVAGSSPELGSVLGWGRLKSLSLPFSPASLSLSLSNKQMIIK